MSLASNIALAVAANLRKQSSQNEAKGGTPVDKIFRRANTFTTTDWVLGKGPTIDIWKVYEPGKPIGVPGAYGSARVAMHRELGVRRVIKTISKRGRDSETIQRFRSEVDTMRKMDHPNVIKFYEAYESAEDLFIVMECCSGGDMFNEIEKLQASKTVPVYSEAHTSKLLKQILSGLKYLHDRSIIHCDLKPDNFVYENESKDAQLKIIDFGMARFWNARERQHFHGTAGTPYYAAPEVVERAYNRACDMWSVGVIVYIMLIGYPPFYADENFYRQKYGDIRQAQVATNNAIRQKVLAGFNPIVRKGVGSWFPEERPISKSAMDFISKLLESDIAKRMTVNEALAHPWIAGDEAMSSPLHPEVLRGLKQFDAKYRFQQAALEMMTELLTNQEHLALTKTFASLDKNGDGLITIREFRDAFEQARGSAQYSREELQQMFNCADVDGDGCICYKELLLASIELKLVAREERIRVAFSKFDTNDDGHITAEEVSQVLNVGVEEAKQLIAEADWNHDGIVDYEDFLEMWRHNSQRTPTAF